MTGFAGGSAWAMARDIAGGFITLTDRSLTRYSAPQITQLSFELERRLREIRGQQPPLEDTTEQQNRHRRIQRLRGALMLIKSYRQRRRL